MIGLPSCLPVRAEYQKTALEEVCVVEGACSYTRADDFRPAVPMLYLPFPETWDRVLGAGWKVRPGSSTPRQ